MTKTTTTGKSKAVLEAHIAELTSVERIARVCHEAMRGYARAMGDLTTPAWVHLHPDERARRLEAVKVAIANPDQGPADFNPNWLELTPEQQARTRIFLSVVRAMQE